MMDADAEIPRLRGSDDGNPQYSWVCGFAFEAYSVKFGIRADEPSVLRSIRDQLPPGSQPAGPEVDRLFSVVTKTPPDAVSGGSTIELYRNEEKILIAFDMGLLLWTLESEIEICLAETTPHHVFVHAGVVGYEDRAILLPGPSFSGKSTLTAGLVRAGATYYSDEYAVLDEHGLVHPYARHLSLRDPQTSLARKHPTPLLSGRVGVHPLPVGLVVIATYRQGAAWAPQPISPGAAMLALLENTMTARHAPQRALEALHSVVESALVLQGERDEADALARELLTIIKRE